MGMMLVSAFAEVVSLGAVMPFLGMLTEPEAVYAMPIMQPLNQFLNISEPKELLAPVTIIFVVAVLTVGIRYKKL